MLENVLHEMCGLKRERESLSHHACLKNAQNLISAEDIARLNAEAEAEAFYQAYYGGWYPSGQ